MSNGEKLGGGEAVELGERSRDEERGIGVRMIRAESELMGGDHLAEKKDEISEQLRQLNEAVFEKVDMVAVIERTVKVARKIDLGKLAELRDELRENPEIGLVKAENYFAEILDLSLVPYLDTDKKLEKRTLGECVNGGRHPDRISVDIEQHQGDMDSVLKTLGHENWHSYQHDVIRRVKAAEEGAEVSGEMRQLAELYEYNTKTYIEPDVDYEGYRRQLYEIEAETFGTLVKMEIVRMKADERKKEDFMAEHVEVYGEENLAGIKLEVHRVLHGLDMGEFLRKAGVQSLDELWQVNEDERVVQGYVVALSDLVGLEQPMRVRLTDKLEDNKRAYLSYETGEVTISRERMWDFQPLSRLPEIAWKMRQREIARNDHESERGKLYRTNLEFYVQDNYKMHEAHKRQLLVRESDYFMKEFLSILDEQATLEEIEMMSPEERAEVKKEQELVGWTPVVSEKYEIKGK